MKLLNRKFAGYLLLSAVGAAAVCLAGDIIENLRVRLEIYPDGKVKTELFAERAEVDIDGSISAGGVVMKRFAQDGTLDVRIDSEKCFIDQESQRASSTNRVVLHRGGIVIKGDGFDWNGGDSKITITKNARVELPMEIIKDEGALKNVKKR